MDTATTIPAVDLSKLSEDALAAELRRRQTKKNENKEAFKTFSNEITPVLFKELRECSETMSKLKAKVYRDLKDLIELKHEAYGIKSDQQSHTFSSDNGESITIGYNVVRGYDDTAMLGVAKVKQFIASLATDEKTAKLVNQITRLLKPTKTGDLDPRRVMELRQMTQEFSNADFIEGVEIIEKAYNPKRSSWFITASFKNGVGIDESLPLSIAAAPFPKDFDLSFLLNDE